MRQRAETDDTSTDADDEWMPKVQVAKYFNVTTMTIGRWLNDPSYAHLDFPKPAVIADRQYWHRPVLSTWMRSRIGITSSRKRESD